MTVRVRMGLHTGEPAATHDRYIGLGMAFVVTAATADAGGTDRPFTGTLAGSATFPLDSSCPFTGRRTWSEASGTASHLGLVTMVSNDCTPPADVITGGQMTLVAANGDELHMTYSGTPARCRPSSLFTRTTCSWAAPAGSRTQPARRTSRRSSRLRLRRFDMARHMAWEGTLSY